MPCDALWRSQQSLLVMYCTGTALHYNKYKKLKASAFVVTGSSLASYPGVQVQTLGLAYRQFGFMSKMEVSRTWGNWAT